MLVLAYLADHPDLVPVLARWHHAEWGAMIRDWPLELAESELRSHSARRAISTTIVALEDGVLAGSASLLEEDMPDMPPIGPWLASVYVAPEARGRGIGSRLVDRVVEEAGALGVERLYLFTSTARTWYEIRGWRLVQPVVTQGHEGVIMHLDLCAGRYSFQPRTADAVPQPGGTMTDLRATWQKVLADLERERDELKLKIHLAKAEGREEFAKLDDRIAELRQRADAAGTEAKGAMGDIGEAARKLTAEIRAGIDRVRKTL